MYKGKHSKTAPSEWRHWINQMARPGCNNDYKVVLRNVKPKTGWQTTGCSYTTQVLNDHRKHVSVHLGLYQKGESHTLGHYCFSRLHNWIHKCDLLMDDGNWAAGEHSGLCFDKRDHVATGLAGGQTWLPGFPSSCALHSNSQQQSCCGWKGDNPSTTGCTLITQCSVMVDTQLSVWLTCPL